MSPDNTPVWDDGDCPQLPVLAGGQRADVCVVGLGGSGLTAIHELLSLGQTVIGIDAGAVGCAAAGRNGGFLLAGTAWFYHEAVEAYGREKAHALYLETMEELERIAADVPECVRRTGSLRIAADADELEDCRRQLAAMQTDDLPVEWYTGPEGEGLLFPRDAAFQPLRRVRSLARRAVAGGARLFENSPAVSLAKGEVRTPGGVVNCDRVIVAVDGRLEALLPELSGRVRTARLNMLATEPATDVHYPRPVYYRHGFEYWQQLEDGRIALGGFRDRGGEAEWTSSTDVSPVVQEMIETFLREHVGTRAAITHRWAAPISFTDDGLPICEEVRDGIWAIGGYSGTGNVVGAVLGRRVAAYSSVQSSSRIFR